MTDDSNLKSGSKGLTRRSALLAGVGLAATGAFFSVAINMCLGERKCWEHG